MANPAAKYTDEFRRETADYVISTGRPISECCRELGLNSKTVNQWVIKLRRELSGQPDPKVEDRELREKVGRLNAALAARATCVVRMVCGIPCVIKGQL